MADDLDPQHFRSRLEDERTRLHGLIDGTRERLSDRESDAAGELADYDQHPADSGTETFEREKDETLLDQFERQLGEVEAALGRIEDGTFGVDEQTGEPIDRDRLEALPTARTNVDRHGDD